MGVNSLIGSRVGCLYGPAPCIKKGPGAVAADAVACAYVLGFGKGGGGSVGEGNGWTGLGGVDRGLDCASVNQSGVDIGSD